MTEEGNIIEIKVHSVVFITVRDETGSEYDYRCSLPLSKDSWERRYGDSWEQEDVSDTFFAEVEILGRKLNFNN